MTTTPAKAYHHGKKGIKAILADLGDAKETWLKDENIEINTSPEAQPDAQSRMFDYVANDTNCYDLQSSGAVIPHMTISFSQESPRFSSGPYFMRSVIDICSIGTPPLREETSGNPRIIYPAFCLLDSGPPTKRGVWHDAA